MNEKNHNLQDAAYDCINFFIAQEELPDGATKESIFSAL